MTKMKKSKMKAFLDAQIKKDQQKSIVGGTDANRSKSATKIHNKMVQVMMS